MSNAPTTTVSTKAQDAALAAFEHPTMTRTISTPIRHGRHPVQGNPGNAAGRTHTVLAAINGGRLDGLSPLDAAGVLITEAARVGGIGYRGTRSTSPERAQQEVDAFKSGGFDAFTRTNLGERALARAGDASTALRYAVNGGGLFAALAALAAAHAAGVKTPALEILARLAGSPTVREAAHCRIGKGPDPEQPKAEPKAEQPKPKMPTKGGKAK